MIRSHTVQRKRCFKYCLADAETLLYSEDISKFYAVYFKLNMNIYSAVLLWIFVSRFGFGSVLD